MLRAFVKAAVITCLLIGLAMAPLIIPAEIMTAEKGHPSSTHTTAVHTRSSGGLFKRLTDSGG
jgi:hypothetical protein